MWITTRQVAVAVAVAGSVLVMARPSAAQFRTLPYGGNMYSTYSAPAYQPYSGYGFGYYPYMYGGNPYSGYLNGSANVISSQGQYLVNTQQAYLLKEQVRGAQLQNRRKAFDEYLYEKSLTPTLNDRRVLEQQEELRRALTNPPETEVWSGKSLNDLFTHIKDLQAKGVELPNVPLSQNALDQINLTVKQVGNIGLLKDAGKLNWPIALQTLSPQAQTTEMRSQIDSLLLSGKKQASTSGRVDPGVVVNLTNYIDQLRGILLSQVGDISFNDYAQGKNYLRQLTEAVKILKQPDVGNYFNGKYKAKGDNVGDLVQYMTENGLTFAPAVAGEESAYSGLFAAMTRYYLGSGSNAQHQSPTRDYYRGLYHQSRTHQNNSPYGSPEPAPPPGP